MSNFDNLLGISLSQANGFVATLNNGEVLESRFTSSEDHSKLFFKKLDLLLNDSDRKDTPFQGIVLDRGPGSFMGVRSGLAIAQGLAFSMKIPILAINSLEIIAQQAVLGDQQSDWIFTAQDARLQECYYALWRYEGDDFKKCLSPAVAALDDAKNQVRERAGKPTSIGNAFDPTFAISAQAMFALAKKKNSWQYNALIKPLYIRNQVAKTPNANN